jgi:DNA-binding LacI/PurR family transcriptional regulator
LHDVLMLGAHAAAVNPAVTPRRPTTLADVAAATGVHPATVSRALSRPDAVAAPTRARVHEAVERLGYVPDRAARRLAGGATLAIAVLVPDVANPFFAQLVQGIQAGLRAADRLVLLADTALHPTTELDAVRSLARNVDGVVVCSPVAPVGRLVEAVAGRELVLVNREARGVASVCVDQVAVVELALEHLRGRGHRRIAVVRGPTGYWSTRRRDTATTGPDVVAVAGVAPTFEGGRRAVRRVVGRGVTAVAAFNDAQAVGLVAGAAELGVAVPGDLAVVGSDGVPLASMSTPPLTTVAAPIDELAAQAVARVLDGAVERATLAPRLVVGGST